MFRDDEKNFLRAKLRKMPMESPKDLRELIDEAKAEEGAMSQPVELRDWFATHAREPPQWWLTQQRSAGDDDLRQLGRWRWIWADAMLVERKAS